MRQLLNDYRGDQSQTSPRKLFFLGSPGAAVFDHHFRYSCTPFFQERQQELGIGLPEGLLLVDAKEPIACGPGDFFICFDPDESARALIEYYTSNIPKEACLLLNYENPVAYHYRKWRFESEILDKFAYVFSSAAHFCDGKKFFWIPAWNFVNDFETNKTIRALECLPSPKSSFLVVNPILTGLDVHRRRLEIISEFVAHRRSFDIFGHQSMLEHPLTQAWKACYRGALPFAPQPYRFEKKLDVFRSYKFTLVIENTFIDGYLSEKLAEPLAVLSVPVYFGAPDISRFMPELFEAGVINGHRFNSTAALIRYLEELSDEEYESRQRCIESHRSDYFALTSRYNIWNYALSVLFQLELSASSKALQKVNAKLQTQNAQQPRRMERAAYEQHIATLSGLQYEEFVSAVVPIAPSDQNQRDSNVVDLGERNSDSSN